MKSFAKIDTRLILNNQKHFLLQKLYLTVSIVHKSLVLASFQLLNSSQYEL